MLCLRASACLLALLALAAQSRIHSVTLNNDTRGYFVISSFGLVKGGSIYVMSSSYSAAVQPRLAGFSIHKSSEESVNYNLEASAQMSGYDCIFDLNNDTLVEFDLGAVLMVPIDPATGEMAAQVYIPQSFSGLRIRVMRKVLGSQLDIFVSEDEGENLYTVAFHSCYGDTFPRVSMSIEIFEVNPGPEFLGAGRDVLPEMYEILSGLFFILIVVWVTVLWRNRSSSRLFKVHILMLVLLIVKFFSLMFHSIDYHFISRYGTPQTGWAVMYYILQLSRGLLLFMTILLIGAGFGLIKHVLSVKEKQLIAVVLSLQVLANTATIIMEETGLGEARRSFWSNVAVLVDLLSCGAILYPVIWSIRHLSQTTGTDGKAAIALVKLRQFRRFYILVLVYIYLTRILVYLVENSVNFHYQWLAPCLDEVFTFAFYVITGYMFSPESENPYLLVPSDDDNNDEYQMDQIVSQTGLTEGLHTTQSGLKTTSAAMRESRKQDETHSSTNVDETEM